MPKGRSGKLSPSQVVKILERQGWRVRRGGHGWLAYPIDPIHPAVTIPSTPSDPRSMLNLVALLKRRGATGLG